MKAYGLASIQDNEKIIKVWEYLKYQFITFPSFYKTYNDFKRRLRLIFNSFFNILLYPPVHSSLAVPFCNSNENVSSTAFIVAALAFVLSIERKPLL